MIETIVCKQQRECNYVYPNSVSYKDHSPRHVHSSLHEKSFFCAKNYLRKHVGENLKEVEDNYKPKFIKLRISQRNCELERMRSWNLNSKC